jgi:hypothetical protein
MVIKVKVKDTHIIDAQKEKPDSQGNEDQLAEDRTLARQWSLPAMGDQKITAHGVCVMVRNGKACKNP